MNGMGRYGIDGLAGTGNHFSALASNEEGGWASIACSGVASRPTMPLRMAKAGTTYAGWPVWVIPVGVLAKYDQHGWASNAYSDLASVLTMPLGMAWAGTEYTGWPVRAIP